MDKIIFPEQKEYLSLLRIGSSPVLQEMEKFAQDNKIPILDKNSAELLEFLIKMKQPERVLEIGTAIGYSAIRIAQNLGDGGIVYTIEKSKDNIDKAFDYINRAEFDNKIKILEGDAFQIIPKLDKKFHFVFLDADKEDYVELLELIIPLMEKGGVLFVDNLLWHGYAAVEDVPEKFRSGAEHIRKFNKLFIERMELQSTIITVGDGIGLAIKTGIS